MIILDIETDGLLDTLTKIHCAVTYDTLTKEVNRFVPESYYLSLKETEYTKQIKDLPTFLDQQAAISCHNGVNFDVKVLKRLLNYEFKGRYVDTLLLSRILFPDIDAEKYTDESGNERTENARHSVNAWALRFGLHKPEHSDWTKFTPEMLHRCAEDVKIQARIYEYCINYMKELSQKDSRTCDKWKAISDLEHEVWRLVEQQADYGWEFDLEKAFGLVDTLTKHCESVESKLLPILPPRVIQLSKTEDGATKAFKSDGTFTKATEVWFNNSLDDVKGDFCRVKFEDFNLNSSDQVKKYLLKHGWEPTEYNFKKDKYNKAIRDSNGKYIQTSPKTPNTAEAWEELAEQLDNPNIALLSEYNKASHRLAQIKGLIAATRPDHRIESRANTCATNTARMTHRTVVNIPKADPTVFYGKEMRSLFKASEGKVLVGCDASALEARCEAHYIYPYSKEQAELLIHGDIHSANAEVFGCTRNTAKTLKYAILYGAGPGKVAAILKCSMGEAKNRLMDYWEANSACKQFVEDLNEEYTKYGYVLGIDGRPLSIRYKHALLNTVLQSCGAIAVKKAIVLFHHHCNRLGFEMDMLTVQHDEIQAECVDASYKDDLQYGDMVGRICVNSIRQAGKDLGLHVPLEAEYKLGKDWGQTH